MVFIAIILIIIIYFMTTWANRIAGQKIDFTVCPICTAVLSTWLILLVFWFFNIGSPILIGILAGQSIAGGLHILEKKRREGKIRHLWLIQLPTIIAGTLIIFLLIEKSWIGAFSIAFLFSIFLLFLSRQRRASKVDKEVKREALKRLSHDLEECCD